MSNFWVGQEATAALVKIGKPAVPELIAALKASDEGGRGQGAADALGKVGDNRAMSALLDADREFHYCSVLHQSGVK